MPTGLTLFRAIRNANQEIVDFQATFCNQLGADLSRQSRQDILTRPLSQRYQDAQAYELFHQYVAVVTTGNTHHQILYLPPQDIWLDVSVVKYGDGLLVSFQDVTTGQKTASLLESVMSSSPAAVRYYESIRDSSGQIVDFLISTGNELAAYRSFRPAQPITGRRLLEVYPYLKTNGLFARYVAVVESGETDHFETSYQLATHTNWFDCTAVRHANGFVLTTLDVTAYKIARLDFERQTELVSGVLNSSASSILVLEPMTNEAGDIVDFRISLANPATLRLFVGFVGREFTLDDLQKQTMLTLFPASREREVFSVLVSVVKTGQAIHQPVDYPQMGIAYDYDIAPFQTGVLMITTDITPLRAYQQELEVKNAALIRSNEYLQQFAYVASHDLQEPLRKIKSFGDLLISQYETQLGEGAIHLSRMQAAADRMSRLIKDLLNFSRISTQQEAFQLVSLTEVVTTTLSDLELRVEETNAVIEVGPLPSLQGDRSQLEQLFLNLLSNSLKFRQADTPPVIRISSQKVAAAALPPSIKPTQPASVYHRIDVTDNGIGFHDKYVDRIFQVFQRLHNRKDFAGTGVGLAICEKVVDHHGGAITAVSQPGQGATFSVYLPAARKA